MIATIDIQTMNVGKILISEAKERYKYCGALSDFSVQFVGINVVFGVENRVIWSPTRGWRVEYGNRKFKKLWREKYEEE